ncbi:hypothetical protein RSK20926_21210 [Roseobacter sp. SK209-2-6]|nr:hypothetical protein RSK20926_21210 [Roseobacter sp. SK209-2-6]
MTKLMDQARLMRWAKARNSAG